MDAKVWELVTNDGPEMFHAFPDGLYAVCDADVLSQGAPRLTIDEVDVTQRDAGSCVRCYSVVCKTTTKTKPKGKTMAAKSTATDTATAEVKYDVTKPEGQAAIDTITANAERVGSLRAEGKDMSADELAAETAEMIKRLSGKGVAAVRATANKALADAQKVPLGTPSAEVAIPTDYREIAGVAELVAAGAEKIREGVAIGLKMADVAKAVGEIQLSQRLRIIDPKTGLPDLNADTDPAKKASKATYEAAREGIAADEVEKIAAHNSLVKGVQNRRSDVLVSFLRALDNTDADNVAEMFPALEIKEGESVTEAVYALYAEKGVELPRKGRTELAAEAAREKARKAKLALEAAEKSGEGDSEGGEGEGNGEGAGEAAQVDPVEYAGAYIAKLAKANKGVKADVFGQLDDEAKSKVLDDLNIQLVTIKALIAELSV
jgi:hypothetical protein